MRNRLLVSVPLALVLTGCAGLAGAGTKTTVRPAVPWIDAKPSGLHQGLATPVAGSVSRQCQRQDLQVIYGGFHQPGGGGGDRILPPPHTHPAPHDFLVLRNPPRPPFCPPRKNTLTPT